MQDGDMLPAAVVGAPVGSSGSEPIAFEEGENLIVEGAESGDCYVILAGAAAVTIGGEPVGAVRVNEVVGERGPIEDRPRGRNRDSHHPGPGLRHLP